MENKETMDNKKSNKLNQPSEIFVLSPLLLENFGISLSGNQNCVQNNSTEETGTDNIITKRKRTKINHSLSDDIKYEELSITKTANLMKNSVFMSPTFVSAENDNNCDILAENTAETDTSIIHITNATKLFSAQAETINSQNDSDIVSTETANLMKNSVFTCPTFVPSENDHNCDTLTENTAENIGLNLTDTPVIHHTNATVLCSSHAEIINSQNDENNIVSKETNPEILSDSSLLNGATYEQNICLYSPKQSHIGYDNSKSTERRLLNVEIDIEHNIEVFKVDKQTMKSTKESNGEKIFTVPLTSEILPISSAKYNTLNDLRTSTDSKNTNISELLATTEKSQCLLISGDIDDTNINVHYLNKSDEKKIVGEFLKDKKEYIPKEFRSDDLKDGFRDKMSIKSNKFKSGGDGLYDKMLTDDNIDTKDEEEQPKNNETISITNDETIKGLVKKNKLINDNVNTNTCQVRGLESIKETDTQALLNVTSSEFKNVDQLDTAKITSDITSTGDYESMHTDKDSVFIYKSKSVIVGIEDSCTEKNKHSSRLPTALNKAKSIEDKAPLDYGLEPSLADANSSKKCVNDHTPSVKVNTHSVDMPKNTTSPLQSNSSEIRKDINRINILQIKNIEARPFSTVNKFVDSSQVVRGRLEDMEILKSKIVNKKYCKNTLQYNITCKNTLDQGKNIINNELKLPSQCSQNNSSAITNINLIASYLKQVTNIRSQNVHQSQSNKSHKKNITKLSAQRIQKRSGDEQQVSNSHIPVIDTKMSLPKTYKRNKKFEKWNINISPHHNDITEQALPQNHSIDCAQEYIHIKSLEFSLHADFGHISYDDSNYDNLENVNYEIKPSNDCTIEDLIIDKNEETNYQFNNNTMQINLKGSVFGETSCSNQELISHNIPQDRTIESDKERKEMSHDDDAQKSNTESTKSSCANDCTHISSQTEIIHNDSSFENDIMNNCADMDTCSIRDTPSEFVDGSSDFSTFNMHPNNQSSNEQQPIIQEKCITLKKASKRIAQNDLLTAKKFKKDTDQSNSNELASSYPETLKCNVCKKKVKIVEWITHVCLKNTNTLSSESGNNVPKYLQKILKKHGFLKCSSCNKQLICVELFLIHINKCHASEKVDDDDDALCNIRSLQTGHQNKNEKSSTKREKVYLNVNKQLELTTDSTTETRNSLTADSVSTDEMISPDDWICGVCHAIIEKENWVTHTQTQHNYFAWRQGEISLDFSKEEVMKNHLINIAQEVGTLICNTCGLKQKRYKRKYDKYIDIYLDHVKTCKSQLSKSNIDAEKGYRITEGPADVNKLSESLPIDNITSGDTTTNDHYSTCGICEQLINDKQWIEHIQLEHNYLAWKKGEPELNLNDPEILQKHLVNILKEVVYLYCNKCGYKQKRYMRSHEKIVLCFMDHIRKCKAQTKDDADYDSNVKIELDDSNLIPNNNAEQDVTCAVCHEVVINNDWIKHIQKKHNYLSWKQEDAPLDLNDPESIQQHFVKLTKKFGSLICNKCDVQFKRYRRTYEQYIHFFLNHVKECKAEDSNPTVLPSESSIKSEYVICAVCSMEMKQNEWRRHLYRKHYNLAWRQNLDEPVDLHNTWMIEKILKDYKATNKKLVCVNCGASRTSCIGFYAHILTCQKTEEEIAPYRFKCEICNGISLNVYRQQHMAAHKVQELNVERKKLKPEVMPAKEEEITPILNGKRKAANKAMAVMEKYKSTVSDLKHKCPTCWFSTDCEQELKKHICDKEDVSSSDSEGSTNYAIQSSSESSEDDNYDDDASDEEGRGNHKNKKSNRDSYVAQKLNLIPFAIKNPDAYLIESCKDFKNLHFTEQTLFTTWKYSGCETIAQEKIWKYLPTLQESCQVYIDSEWITYKRFEARITTGYSIFTGGCLSCMAWAPSRKGDGAQYLAVVAHNTPDTPRLLYASLYEHAALLQIWTFEDFLGTTLPVLSLGIAHEYGTIWAMDWCPSGARDPFCPDTPVDSRLGLLAIACSNGLAYILSIPQPSQLTDIFYKFKPVAELRLCMSSDRSMQQATSISWSKQKGHSIVAVGYADGCTAMFDLNTDSPILRNMENNIDIFYPYCDEKSMSTAVTGVSIYPSADVGSVGADVAAVGCGSSTGAMMRLGASGGVNHVISTRVPANDVLFMSQWPTLYCTIDDNTPSLPWTELEMWGGGRRGGTSQVAAECLTCARLFTWTSPLVRVMRAHPAYPVVKRHPIALFRLVPLHGKRRKMKPKDDLTIELEPTAYEDAIKKYGIEFKTMTGISERNRGINSNADDEGRPERYPLAEVRGLAPCPAQSCHKWIAIASHAGVIFVIRT